MPDIEVAAELRADTAQTTKKKPKRKKRKSSKNASVADVCRSNSVDSPVAADKSNDGGAAASQHDVQDAGAYQDNVEGAGAFLHNDEGAGVGERPVQEDCSMQECRQDPASVNGNAEALPIFQLISQHLLRTLSEACIQCRKAFTSVAVVFVVDFLQACKSFFSRR